MKKLPPYGAKLLKQRNARVTPARVWVIFGRDCWERLPVNAPTIAISDETFAPGLYDWTPVVGVPVHLVWRSGPKEKAMPLVAELAQATAPVVVHFFGDGDFPYTAGQPFQIDAEEFLYEMQRFGLDPGSTCWSAHAAEDYNARWWEYHAALDYTQRLARQDGAA